MGSLTTQPLPDTSTTVAGSTTLISNSIGTITALQAAVDSPELFNGVMTINPNFRELHTAETPSFAHPLIRAVQRTLRSKGQGLFDTLANPKTVKQVNSCSSTLRHA